MTRVATPENEDLLLRIARQGTASHVEKVVGKYKSVQSQEGEAVEKEVPTRYQDLLEHTRADALARMAEHFLATAGQSPQFQNSQLKGLKGSERCQLVLHVDINTLADRLGFTVWERA